MKRSENNTIEINTTFAIETRGQVSVQRMKENNKFTFFKAKTIYKTTSPGEAGGNERFNSVFCLFYILSRSWLNR